MNDGNLKLKRNGINLAIRLNSFVPARGGCFAVNGIVEDVIVQPVIKSSFIRIHCLIHREQESGLWSSFCNLVMLVSSFVIVSSSLNCLESSVFPLFYAVARNATIRLVMKRLLLMALILLPLLLLTGVAAN